MPKGIHRRFDPDDVAEDRAERKRGREEDQAQEDSLRHQLKHLGGNRTLHFTMDVKDALELGLITCACGHRTNNHFLDQKDRPCAHCNCKKLKVVSVRGTLKEEDL